MRRVSKYAVVLAGCFLLLFGLRGSGLQSLFAASEFALQFDGVDDRVTFGAAPQLGAQTFTLELWFKKTGAGVVTTTGTGGVTSAIPLLTKGRGEAEGSNVDMNYFLGIDSVRRVLAADFEDMINGGNHPVLGQTPICDNIWYHAAATYDGTTWRLFLNGELETALVVGTAGQFVPRFDSIQHAGLATAMTSTGVAAGFFKGSIDEARIWNVARSQSAIQSTMGGPVLAAANLVGRWGLDEGTGTSAANSAGLPNGTLAPTVPTPPVWVAGSGYVTGLVPGNDALKLTVSGDYVTFGAATSTLGASKFTVETWFKREATGTPTSTGTGGLATALPLVTKGRAEGENSNVDMNYFLGINTAGANAVIAADFEEGGAGTSPGLNHPISGSTPILLNTWYHAAVTYDGTALQLYLNGAPDGPPVVVGQPPRFDSIQHAALGTAMTSTGAAAGFFTGSLDEARIWNYARTAAQISASANREIPNGSGLLARWSFNDCCGRVVDSTGHLPWGTLQGTGWGWAPRGLPALSTAINTAPSVDAGADQTVTLPALANLAGVVTDDSVNTGAPLTTLWTKTSGPGLVTFANASAQSTTATFSAGGTYVLTLSATDGELSGADTVSVQVTAGLVNLPPTADAGPDQIITFPAPASLTGLYTDDGVPGVDPTTMWSVVSGPGAVAIAQTEELSTTASFAGPGTYVLMLTVSDGVLSAADTVTITVNPSSSNAAIDLNGTSGYVALGQAPGLGAATFTLEAWIKREGAGVATSTGTGGITAIPLVTKGMAQADGSNVDMNYFMGIRQSDGVIAADFEDAATGLNHPVAGATAIPANGVWHHVAATYDGNTWRVYVDGALDGQSVVGAFTPRADSIQHAAIGSALGSGGTVPSGQTQGFFSGVMDEVRIWNAARSPQQIQDGMSSEIPSAPGLLGRWGLNEGTGTTAADGSGHSINGNVLGGFTWVAGAPFGTANRAPAAPVLQTPANGATGVTSPATLSVAVADGDGEPVTVTYYGRLKPAAAPDFTYVTIPDTQHYVDNTSFPGTFTAQTNWIVNNRAAMNIAFVSHLGDVAEHQDQFPIEWQRADTSMTVLDVNNVPYGVSPGNHDQNNAGVAALYDQYFPPSRFLGRPWYIGYLGSDPIDPINRLNKDNYELFSVGGLDFLVIHIEMDWPGYAVTWADRIIKKYPTRRVILSTHLFLDTSNTRPTSSQFRGTGGTSAEAVWQQLIKPNCNVFMVVNGHYPGEGRRTDVNNCGQPVHQVLMDYQSRINGGDGWLRYFVFKPSENKIAAFTYSPTRNGGLGDFETDDSSQFVLDYDMQGSPFSVVGTTTNVASGGVATTTWNGLVAAGRYEWYATVTDGKVTTTGPVWSFTAAAANVAPVAKDDSATTAEDTPATIAVLANDTDADGGTLSVASVTMPAHGTATINGDGTVTYAPAPDYNGLDSFSYTVTDGQGGAASATVSVTITSVNDAPVAKDDAATTAEDTAATIAVLANDSDADGGTLSVASVTMPAHGTATINGDGTVTYAPAPDYNGLDSFSYTVIDGQGGAASATVSVTITSVNDAPVAKDDAATTAEDTAATIAVLANDSDADGGTLSVASVTMPAHGTATINGDGTVTYAPAPDYNGLDSFSYTVIDGQGGAASATVSVTITSVNDAPVAKDDAATTAEDTAATIAVLANDSDADGGTLSVASVTTPGHGTATINGDGTVTYAPAPDYNGLDSFSYTVIDGQGGAATATVSVTITSVNDAPVAKDDAATTAEDTAATIAVLANDSDADGGTLSVASVTTPGHGTATINGDGTVAYAPAADFNGSDSFSYTVNDGQGDTATATVSVTITSVNDAPVAKDDAATTAEDTAATIAVLANDSDADGGTLSVASVTMPAHGTASINGDGTVTYAPAADFNGSDSFSYTVNDGQGDTATATVSVTITSVNDAPVAKDDAATTAEDTAATIAVLANDSDADGGTLSVASVTMPAHGTATINGDGTVTYAPAANYNGSDSFSYTVNDGQGGSATAAVSVTITSVNDAPVAKDDAATTAEDTAATIAVLANDSDADGGTLSVASVTMPAHGTATINGDGTVTYAPAANYNGSDSFSYTVNDGQGGSATAAVSVTITSVNDAPVAKDDAATTAEDTAATIAVLANDSDADGGTLSVASVTMPAHGTATINGDGTVTYAPAANYNGADSFTYTVSDGQGGAASATVSVTITSVNDAPVAKDDAATTAEDTAATIAVLANDSDADGGTVSVASVTTPAHGTATINGDGTVTYAPAANYNGSDSFAYTVNDGQGGSATATVSVTVTSVNDGPVAKDDAATTAEDTAATIAVLANDSDADGGTVSVASVTTPAHGTATINGDGTVTYAPAADYNGADSFTYTVSDGQGGAASATVSVTITSVNDAPVAKDDAATTAEDTAATIAVLANDSDADGGTVSVASVTLPMHGTATINGDGTVTYAPAANYNGSDSFSYTVNDGQGGSATATVSVTITSVNDGPVAKDDAATTAEDTAATIAVLANDSDADGGTVSVASVTMPGHGTATINGDGTVTYAPAADYNGADSFTYTISDGQGGSATGAVSVTITGVNDGPVAKDDAATTAEDTAATIAVLANDSDADGGTLSVASVTMPGHGTATINGDGTVTYAPAANYNGADSFTYTITDGQGGSATAIVSVTITGVNDAPAAKDDSATTAEDTAATIAVLANDTDADGDSLTVTTVSMPGHGEAEIGAGGTITYTPAANYYGADSFTYTMGDGHGGTATATVSVTITSVNDAPVAVNDSTTTPENTPATIAVLANDTDVDGDSLSIASFTTPAHGTVTINAGGTLKYSPAANYNGPDSFSYTAADGHGGTATAAVTVTVTNVNNAPVAVNDSAATLEDQAVTIAVLANDTDADGGTLQAVLVSAPSHGAVALNADGSFRYTPVADFNGADSFRYKASDGAADSNVATVTVVIDAVNDEPVAGNNSYSTNEDQVLTIAAPGVLGNDTDIDGGPLKALLVSGPSHGTVVLNANGSFSYTPAANFSGADSFSYEANDGTDDSDPATVSIAVNPVNDAPVAVSDSVATQSGQAVSIMLEASDADGNALTYRIVRSPANGTLTGTGANRTYTPRTGFTGADSFTFVARDGVVDSNVATVSITVTSKTNQPPVAESKSVQTNEDTRVSITLEASDPEGKPLKFKIISGPKHGELTGEAPFLKYRPDADYNGPDSFTFRAADSKADSNLAKVSITVKPVNDAPEAKDFTIQKSGSGPVIGFLRGTDVDGDSLTFRIVRGPARGKVTVDPKTGRFVYTPPSGNKRIDVTFRYVVNDGTVDSDRAFVKIDYCNGRHDGHNRDHDHDDDDRYDHHDRDEHDWDWGWNRDR